MTSKSQRTIHNRIESVSLSRSMLQIYKEQNDRKPAFRLFTTNNGPYTQCIRCTLCKDKAATLKDDKKFVT